MLKNIILEDIPESSRYIAQAIGIEKFIILVELVGGDKFYVPSVSSLIKGQRNRMIKEMFRGSYSEVARHFGMSAHHVKQIIKGQ